MPHIKHYSYVFLLFCFLQIPAHASNRVWIIDVKGGIGPATADHMVRGLEQAQEEHAPFVILKIDTPGGLDSAMREMIKAVLACKIPVIGYVSPSGARAASAGTYLLYATHIAAMAPATNLGAATPVQIGAPELPSIPSQTGSEETDEQPALAGSTAMERKITNDAVAYIQGLADLRERNSEWAARAVREGVSLPAEEALSLGVIDIVATDINNLMQQLDGYIVKMGDEELTLSSSEVDIYHHPIDWRNEFLSVITDPNVAYILILIGVYGLIFEASNPGFGVPGIIGAVCIFVALYAFQVLPVSYAGLALMMLGIGLMTAEAFAPSFGILGLGGITAFTIGSIILMDTEHTEYQIAIPLILAFAAFSALILVFTLGLIVKARKQVIVTGIDHYVGNIAEVESLRGDTPLVRLDGELWQVQCDQPLAVHDSVTVRAVEGVGLVVTKNNGER
ncbi:nodulation protein NfeD [Neptunomonas sp.]|uniref:NfeD family protein n=1 Tax=Neptunomonas sp. TaxID=1971898 RepID=UPI003565BDB3